MYHNARSFDREAGAEHKLLELYFYDDDPSLEHRYPKCRQQQLHFLETIAGFLKLVELCKGLVMVPYLTSLVEMYGV
jgi:hypothetical protein